VFCESQGINKTKKKRVYCKRTVDDEEIPADPLLEPIKNLLKMWRKQESQQQGGQRLVDAPTSKAPRDQAVAVEALEGGDRVMRALEYSAQSFLAPDSSQACSHEKRWAEAILDAHYQVEDVALPTIIFQEVLKLRLELTNIINTICNIPELWYYWDINDYEPKDIQGWKEPAMALIAMSHTVAIKAKARDHCLSVIKVCIQDGCGSMLDAGEEPRMMRSAKDAMMKMLYVSLLSGFQVLMN